MSYYIAPNSTVMLLKNVPLDPSYRNTLYFSGDGYQYQYFNSMAYTMLTTQSYQRVSDGAIRVEVLADNVYDCNYMMFINNNFGSKWFYAFITDVTYINNNTTEIKYTIDALQTWMFETEIMPCFVSREHTDDDTIGNNIIPENVDLGEFVANSYSELTTTLPDAVANTEDETAGYSKMATVVAICDTDPLDTKSNLVEWIQNYFSWGDIVNCTMYDGALSGSWLFAYDTSIWSRSSTETYSISDAINAISDLIENWTKDGKPDAIMSIYECPILNLTYNGRNYVSRIGQFLGNIQQTCATNDFSLDGVSEGDTLDGYTPKNNKLYTYPYCFCNIQNGNGENMILRYEFSDNDDGDISLVGYGTVSYPVQVVLKPTNYKGISGTNDCQSLTLNNFPSCSWNSEYYAAWYAQTSVPYYLRTAGSMINSALGGITPNVGNETWSYTNPSVSASMGNGNSAFSGSQFTGMSLASGSPYGGTINIPGSSGSTSRDLGSARLLNAGLNMTKQTVSNVTNRLASSYSASVHADINGGNYNNGGANCASHRQTFYGGRFSISYQYARQIDEYFNVYGYATNRVKVPNIQDGNGNYQMVRAQWQYEQTEGCIVKGDIPTEAKQLIQKIFDGGITFWKNPGNVGRYDLSNSIVS